ncbi:MAG TPA: aminotransferase class V-fold PLP-dependent enzyme [Caulobacteraceae bacterium]|nr:aminotransferase class V-fold PLP-dependent enzyme [Caulobacteraceae bacterium]
MEEKAGRVEFGAAARWLWRLQPGPAFLNHGSFGACPKAVLDAQDVIRDEMERAPDQFFETPIMPDRATGGLRAVAEEVGAFIGAPGEAIALVENATTGIQAVLNSLDLGPGDEVLTTSQRYNAVRLAVEERCARAGAVPVAAAIPLGAGEEEMVERIEAAVTARTRFAIIDHVASPTALIFPVATIAARLGYRGVKVLIDGAHAIGQLPLDLPAIGADWHVTNAHKWLFAPKGCGLLWASPRVAPSTKPAITSHFVGLGFPYAFDYIGTRDYSGWLALPAALAFWRRLGGFQRLGPYNRDLIGFASDVLARIGAQPVGTPGQSAFMRAFILPTRAASVLQDALDLRRELWAREQIQVAAGVLDGALLLRLSAQAYVTRDDFARLAEALDRLGWRGRQ